jgi:hypothetical protein
MRGLMLSVRQYFPSAGWFLAPFALSGLLATNAWTASGAGAQESSPVTKLVVVVDGSKSPEQIPDDLAWRHFLLALAAHAQPSAQEKNRQKAQFAPLGLSDADRQELVHQLGLMTAQLEAIDAERQASDGSDVSVAGFKARYDAAVSQAVASVRAALSDDGLIRFSRYIADTVKRNIKIYGSAKN